MALEDFSAVYAFLYIKESQFIWVFWLVCCCFFFYNKIMNNISLVVLRHLKNHQQLCYNRNLEQSWNKITRLVKNHNGATGRRRKQVCSTELDCILGPHFPASVQVPPCWTQLAPAQY